MQGGEAAMAQYAPTGAVVLVVGACAAVATSDLLLIVLVVVLAALTYGAGVAVHRATGRHAGG